MFLAQLAGFVVGGAAGWFLAGFGLWLALGAPTGPDSGGPAFAYMLFLGPVGFLTGGFVTMRLVGKWLKASLHHDAEPAASPNGGPATRPGNSGVTEGPPSVN